MTRMIVIAGAVAAIACLAAPVIARASVTLYNAQGASAPCTGIGPIGGPAAEHCAQMFEQQGFVRANAVGSSGLTIGAAGESDGVVTRIDVGSPAAQAGLAAGDVVVMVDGRGLKPTPGSIAAERIFGRRGDKINVTVRRGGADRTVDLILAHETAPTGPKWDNAFIANRLLVNWRGDFIPCVGAGPLAIGFLAYCTNHFKPFGFVEAEALGGAGLTMDMNRKDGAWISAVEPESPAARVGLQPSDQVLAVNGQALKVSLGEVVRERLFGKAGELRRVTVERGGEERSFTLTLAPTHE